MAGFGGWTNEILHGPCAVEEDAEALDTESEGWTVVSSSLRVLAEMKDSYCLVPTSIVSVLSPFVLYYIRITDRCGFKRVWIVLGKALLSG